MIGDGPYRAELEARAIPGVTIFGRVPFREREERLVRAHVLAAASVREGWGLNVSEAAACGTPTTRWGRPATMPSVDDDPGVEDDGVHQCRGCDDGADDGPNHDVGDDHGIDDPATHDVGDDHGVDDPATHDVDDDHGDDSGDDDSDDDSGHHGDDGNSGRG